MASAGHRVFPLTPLSSGMPDTKRGRERQARKAAERRQTRDVEEARARADEAEPPLDRQGDADEDDLRTCHRRGCDNLATFLVLERYQEDTGHGAVEAEAALCRMHTAEEHPTNLDGAYADYVFRVVPIPGAVSADGE